MATPSRIRRTFIIPTVHPNSTMSTKILSPETGHRHWKTLLSTRVLYLPFQYIADDGGDDDDAIDNGDNVADNDDSSLIVKMSTRRTLVDSV